jgi:hypothetical protein
VSKDKCRGELESLGWIVRGRSISNGMRHRGEAGAIRRAKNKTS